MRKYKNQEVTQVTQELEAVICNQCGKLIPMENGIQKEDVCTIHKKWGYFSGKDMEEHSFDLCEACYDKLIAGFQYAVERKDGVL